MQLNFAKYHGAGNDFVIFEDRGMRFPNDMLLLEQNVAKHINYHPKKINKIVIYNRKDAQKRVLINDIQLRDKLITLGNYDVEIIDSFSHKSFSEQIELINNCKIFISPTGANLTNLGLIDKNVIIFEIDNRNSWPLMFGIHKLFKKYYTPKFTVTYNKNRGGIGGMIQENPTFDDNLIVDIEDVFNTILKLDGTDGTNRTNRTNGTNNSVMNYEKLNWMDVNIQI